MTPDALPSGSRGRTMRILRFLNMSVCLRELRQKAELLLTWFEKMITLKLFSESDLTTLVTTDWVCYNFFFQVSKINVSFFSLSEVAKLLFIVFTRKSSMLVTAVGVWGEECKLSTACLLFYILYVNYFLKTWTITNVTLWESNCETVWISFLTIWCDFIIYNLF